MAPAATQRAILVLVGVSGLIPTGAVRAQDVGGQRRVLMISCDGLRPDAIEAADAPVMQSLIATGSYQATCLSELPPVTLPNHASMVTGLTVRNHGVYANSTLSGRIEATTIFDAAIAADLGVGFFIGKGKLAYLCEETAADVWRLSGDMDALAADVEAGVEAEDLHLIFVHLGGPDSAGHREGWMSDAYLAAVAATDAAIGRILDVLQTAGVLDETVVIIAADHGGHDRTHFLDIAEDRFIPFILNGPGIAVGRSLCEQVRTMDAAATALFVLGLPMDAAADGRPVTEAWADFDPAACTAPEVAFAGLCGTLSVFFAIAVVGLMVMRVRRW